MNGCASPPVRAWNFDPRQLRDGDVLLERGDGWKAAVTAAATRGSYSHALIWVGGTDFAEAMPDGSRVISFARVPVSDPERWQLLRLRDEVSGFGRRAAVEARNLVHRPYDLGGALTSVALGRGRRTLVSLFCSQLVGVAYRRAGLQVVPGRRNARLTPNGLLDSPHFMRQPAPLAEVRREDVSDYLAAFGERSEAYRTSRPAEEAAAVRAAFQAGLRALRPLEPSAAGVVGDLNELYAALPKLAPAVRTCVADVILMTLEKHAYFDLGDRAHLDLLATLLDDPQLAIERADGWAHTSRRYRSNETALSAYSAAFPHELWTRLSAMYRGNAERLEKLAFAAAPTQFRIHARPTDGAGRTTPGGDGSGVRTNRRHQQRQRQDRQP